MDEDEDDKKNKQCDYKIEIINGTDDDKLGNGEKSAIWYDRTYKYACMLSRYESQERKRHIVLYKKSKKTKRFSIIKYYEKGIETKLEERQTNEHTTTDGQSDTYDICSEWETM